MKRLCDSGSEARCESIASQLKFYTKRCGLSAGRAVNKAAWSKLIVNEPVLSPWTLKPHTSPDCHVGGLSATSQYRWQWCGDRPFHS